MAKLDDMAEQQKVMAEEQSAMRDRLESGDNRFTSLDEKLEPLNTLVTAMGGPEEFTAAGKELADGVRAIGTIGRWVKRLVVASAVLAAGIAGIKYMVWEMWRVP